MPVPGIINFDSLVDWVKDELRYGEATLTDSSGRPVHLRKVQGRGSDVFAIIDSSSYTSNGTRGGDITYGGVHLERGAGRETGYDIPILWYWIDKDAAIAAEEYQRYAPEREAEELACKKLALKNKSRSIANHMILNFVTS